MSLLACPRCARQYDVRSLQPGAKLRCSCEHVMEVGWKAPLPATVLKCDNCGGGVGAEDETCPYCGCEVSERDRMETALCPVCFTRIHAESRICRSCGVDIRPQALSPLRDGSDCPRCTGDLVHRDLGAFDVIECADCRGLWLQPDVFERACRTSDRRPARSALAGGAPERKLTHAPERKLTHAQELRYIPCLACGELMIRRQFRDGGKASGIVVDVCREHGIWLDHREIEKILAFLEARAAETPGPEGLEESFAAFEARHGSVRSKTRPDSKRTGIVQGTLDVLSELLIEIFG